MINYEMDLIINALDFANATNNLPERLQNELPDIYGYLWAKCSLMMNLGFEQYSKGDYFHFPLKEWVTKDFESGINQILNDLNGFSVDNPITVNDTVTMHYINYSLHFKINSIITDTNNVIQVNANHLVKDDEDITLCFFIQEKL